jgi:hypothetical protein
MASKALNSDHSTASVSSTKRTPRMGAATRSSTAHSSGSQSSGLTAEEKHIARMRQVMSKREAASGLPQRYAASSSAAL